MRNIVDDIKALEHKLDGLVNRCDAIDIQRNIPDEISYKEDSPGIWRITVNGRILGDSRGYNSKAEARAAALKQVNYEHSIATRQNRQAYTVFRPGY
jgi:hypothetical protein